MRKLEDLRFAIGLFFALVGVLLLIASAVAENADSATLNFRVGVGILLFGLGGLLSSVFGKKTDS